MNRFKIIAFTHKSLNISDLSVFYIEEDRCKATLGEIKDKLFADEIFYLSTCNRVAFFLATDSIVDRKYLQSFFSLFNSSWSGEQIEWAIDHSLVFEGDDAIRHLLEVASSIDSLIVGEREIITQVRKAYENCRANGLTGDFFRLIMQNTIRAAKEIFTDTLIAEKPISVVSLAYRKLRDLNVKLDSRFLIIGAGETNTNMAKYLLKHGFTNFTVFNRSLVNGERLAAELNCKALPLSSLKEYEERFDVIVSCTSSAEPIITKEIYQRLLNGDTSRKVIIDLAIPNDVERSVSREFNVCLIEVASLKEIAKENLKAREMELAKARTIVEEKIGEFKMELKKRNVEIVMQNVPVKVREIRQTAVNTVFAKDIEQLDAYSKEVLEKVLSYMEKKYISVPMVLAKDILLRNEPN